MSLCHEPSQQTSQIGSSLQGCFFCWKIQVYGTNDMNSPKRLLDSQFFCSNFNQNKGPHLGSYGIFLHVNLFNFGSPRVSKHLGVGGIWTQKTYQIHLFQEGPVIRGFLPRPRNQRFSTTWRSVSTRTRSPEFGEDFDRAFHQKKTAMRQYGCRVVTPLITYMGELTQFLTKKKKII